MNRISMFLARAALPIAIGETAAISAAASPAAALDGTAAVSERVLWRFAGAPDDGDGPGAALITDKWGNLYGTTMGGGANSCRQSCFAPDCVDLPAGGLSLNTVPQPGPNWGHEFAPPKKVVP